MNVEQSVNCIIVVDGDEFKIDHTQTNGTEIKTIANVPGEYALFLEEEGDKPDREISDGETIELRGKIMCFYAVPPATFGEFKSSENYMLNVPEHKSVLNSK